MSLFEELKRRNVIRVSIAYIVAAWLILQLSDILLDNMEAPDWVFQVILLLLGIGLVLTVFFAWAFELTPDGVVRAEEVDLEASITSGTGRKVNFLITILLVAAVLLLLTDKFSSNDDPDAAIETAVEAEAEKSIAVLPLRTRSNVEEDDYFADGIHDDLLTQLAKLSSLDKVISRTSTERYRDTTMSMQAIGAELGVATILEGGVQRAGTRVRINMQLIDAATDEHLWADTYERELTVENLFAIQSEITREVVNALHIVMSDEETERVAAAPTNSLDAHREYALGRREMAKRNADAIISAQKHFEAAVALDAGYVDAWVAIADSLILQDEHVGIPFEQNEKQIQAAIDEALKLDPNSGKAYTALANITDERGQVEKAEEYFKKAIELSPNYETAYHWYALLLRDEDRIEESLANIEKAVALNPLAPILTTNLAFSLWNVGRNEEAIEVIDKSLQSSPDNSGTNSAKAYFLEQQGNAGESLRWTDRAVELNPGHSGTLFSQCMIQLKLGLTSMAETCIDQFGSRFEQRPTYLQLSLHLSQNNLSAANEFIASMPEQGLQPGEPRTEFLYYFATNQVELLRPIVTELFPNEMADDELVVDASNLYNAFAAGMFFYMDGQLGRANNLFDQSLALMKVGKRIGGLDYEDQDIYIHTLRGDIDEATSALREFLDLRIVNDHWMYDIWVFDDLREDSEAAALFEELNGIIATERQWYLDHKDEPLF